MRLFLTYILPLLAPLVLYLLWNTYARTRAKKKGEELPSLQKGGIFWSLVVGFVLLVATFVTLAVTGGHPTDSGKYVAPRIEDGKIVPPTFKNVPAQ